MESRGGRAFSAGALVLLLSGCATLPNGRGWGEDATLAPGWDRVRQSAVDAIRDPWVWVPLLGAAAFQIDDWDRDVSDWARENTPMFGSQESAEDWSDDLRTASVVSYHLAVLATPSGADAREWFINKAKGYAVGLSASALTRFTTRALKTSVGRTRPNGEDDESFPSGHTSTAAVYTQLASRNLRAIDLSDSTRLALDIGLDALTLGTSWARIEAGWHYPSDTLFSIALGNFLASFFNDAFLGLDENPRATVALAPQADGATLSWRWRF